MDDRTGRPVVYAKREARPQQFIIGDDEAEMELSVESRSSVNRVNDQVRKRQKNFKCYRKWRRIFYDMVNVHVCNIGISNIHGKEFPAQLSFHHEQKRSHIETNVRHICKISVWTKWDLWIGNNWLGKPFMEIYVFGDERVISLQRTKVYVFSDCVLCLGKIFENTQSNDAWEERLGWFKSSMVYRSFDRIDGEPMEFEWNISQDSIRCSSVKKSKVYCWN